MFAAIPTGAKFAYPMKLSIDQIPEELWVFGYGSLLWRPGFAFLEKVPARVTGRGRMSISLRVGAETREEALRLCERLRSNGAVCTVQRN